MNENFIRLTTAALAAIGVSGRDANAQDVNLAALNALNSRDHAVEIANEQVKAPEVQLVTLNSQVRAVETANEQNLAQEILPPIVGVEIVTSDGQRDILTYQNFVTQPYFESVQSSIQAGNEKLQDYLNEHPDPDRVIPEIRLVFPGNITQEGQILPTPTPDSTPIQEVFDLAYSWPSGGAYFKDDQLFTYDNDDLLAIIEDTNSLLYVGPVGDRLVAFDFQNNTSPVIVAEAQPNYINRSIRWEAVSSSVFVEQINQQELQHFTSGIRVNIQGKNWEFLSDLPGVTFDANAVNVESLTNLLFIATHSGNPDLSNFESPSTETIKVYFSHNNNFDTGYVDLSDDMNPMIGISLSYVENGVMHLEIPYSDEYLELLNSEWMTPEFIKTEVASKMFRQVFYGGRANRYLNPGDNFYDLMHESFGLVNAPPEQYISTYDIFGMSIDLDTLRGSVS